MPELPEVETTKRGIEPHLKNQEIKNIIVRNKKLRWPIDPKIINSKSQTVKTLQRRGKYIIIELSEDAFIIHLGMSGVLRIVPENAEHQKHDHVDLVFKNHIMRFTDPRRFGCFIYTKENPYEHSLIQNLGVEPLSENFNVKYLADHLKKSERPIKNLIMDSHIVVGVGNIYAQEALFLAKIHPNRKSNTLTLAETKKLITEIKKILQHAIERGGTTLRDFLSADGKPGYFQQELYVYGRKNLPCKKCKTILNLLILQNRSTVYCENCQH